MRLQTAPTGGWRCGYKPHLPEDDDAVTNRTYLPEKPDRNSVVTYVHTAQ